jgi:hypothetical protein
MVSLPKSLVVTRSRAKERVLNEQMRAWVEGAERAPGVHASDILDPRLAYWRRKQPRPLPARLVWMFATGRILHELWYSARRGLRHLVSDGGPRRSEDLGITFSPDDCEVIDGRPVEWKTTRSFYAPTTLRDLRVYVEQLLVYMAALDVRTGDLPVLYLNLRDPETRRTEPQVRVFELRVAQHDLDALKTEIRETARALQDALARGDHTALPLCREWKCGRDRCDYFDHCKPEGRWKPRRLRRSSDS